MPSGNSGNMTTNLYITILLYKINPFALHYSNFFIRASIYPKDAKARGAKGMDFSTGSRGLPGVRGWEPVNHENPFIGESRLVPSGTAIISAPKSVGRRTRPWMARGEE